MKAVILKKYLKISFPKNPIITYIQRLKEQKRLKKIEEEQALTALLTKIDSELQDKEHVLLNRQKQDTNEFRFTPKERNILDVDKHFCKECGGKFHRIFLYDYDEKTGEPIIYRTNWLRCDNGHDISIRHPHPITPSELGQYIQCEYCGIVEYGYYWG